jgi:ADP-heptose:LPS heptosyltransferase
MHSLDIFTGAPIPLPALLPETREVVQLSLLAAGVEYDDPLLLLCPQVEESRAWPLDYWVELAARLLAARPERVAVLGAPEVDWPLGVVKVMPVQDSLVLTTLLARATLVVAPDAAALHLADMLGTPAVGLYGPTDPAEVALPDSRCQTLYQPQGVAEITPEAVVAAIAEVLPR